VGEASRQGWKRVRSPRTGGRNGIVGAESAYMLHCPWLTATHEVTAPTIRAKMR
jgi:hypothetical protein